MKELNANDTCQIVGPKESLGRRRILYNTKVSCCTWVIGVDGCQLFNPRVGTRGIHGGQLGVRRGVFRGEHNKFNVLSLTEPALTGLVQGQEGSFA